MSDPAARNRPAVAWWRRSSRSRSPSPRRLMRFVIQGSSGLTEYLDKRHRLRTQGVNLVEIDLLIAGRRLPMAKPLPPGDFFTIISRASKSELGDVYAWSIQRPLPKIPIPLEDPDPDVFLDLAEVFALAYQRGRYARLINYNRPLDLPLYPQDKEWAEKVARGKAPS